MVYSYFPSLFCGLVFANNFFLQCLVLTLYMNFKGYFNINLIKIGISMLETVVEYKKKKRGKELHKKNKNKKCILYSSWGFSLLILEKRQ